VHFHPVVDRFEIIPALDPIWISIFLLAFLLAAYAALRRPAYAAAMLVFYIPLSMPHTIFSTTVTFEKVALIGVLAGLASRRGATLPRHLARPILIAFIGIIIVDLATFAVAEHRSAVARESLKWIEYGLYFFAQLVCYTIDTRATVLRNAFAATFLFVAFTALSELFTGASSGMYIGSHAVPRIAGLLEGPNQLGGYTEIAIAAFAAFQARSPNRLNALLLFVAGITLALTFSRAAFLGVLLIAGIIAWNERSRVRRIWTVAAGAVLGFFVMLASSSEVDPSSFLASSAAERASDTFGGISGGVGTRGELWHAALTLFRAHPILGVGAGNFELELGETGLSGVRTQANNWYLQALAEGGLALFAATLAWLFVIFTTLRSRIKSSPWALGAFAASVAMAVHGFTDDLMFYPKVAEMWIALIALGCVRS
jgi:O-antigen ligase